ncbi:MAG TPA: hypothetical protein VK958_06365 [Methylophilus sp.]|uniref:hypothetical protein n=1 Tax=Methylophilus sp. TaxID=29541 RepID=UPI002C0781F6|nr:hypothetical protein [Methylophilus sp.]HSH86858.1 hypothetical protein [Methylophilus sp.]
MELSKLAYSRAMCILEYIGENPDKPITEIANTLGYTKECAQLIATKLFRHGVVNVSTRNTRGGKTYYYSVTGKPMPERVQPNYGSIQSSDFQLATPPQSVEAFNKLPSFLRAITPVIHTDTSHARHFQGHSIVQYKQQSALARNDRRVAQSGVKYSGESRL